MRERIYIGGFEIYREYDASGETVTLERETLHVGDDDRRAALVETRTAGADGSPARVVRYQLANHLGSATLELDESSHILSYEEYYPYGGTSYEAVASVAETPKRYRATAKERDEESGLYYHGARYYAPWLGRWTACDTLLADGYNLYQYVKSSPTVGRDRIGNATEGTTSEKVTSLRFRDASRVVIGDRDVVFFDEHQEEFLRLSAATFNKVVSATGIDLTQVASKEASSGEFRQRLVKEYYRPFSSGNPAATNVVGEGRFRFEKTTQALSDPTATSGMECFWTSYVNQLKSLGLIPPDMTRSAFEHTFTNIHPESEQRPLSVLIERSAKIGFPASKRGIKDKESAPQVFRDIANAFASDKNNEWASFTGMAGKRFEAERLAGKRMIERIEDHWRLGETVHLGYPGHYVLGVGKGDPGKPPLYVDPLGGDDPTGGAWGLNLSPLETMGDVTWAVAMWPK
jgi:RHS repeat-associated protein